MAKLNNPPHVPHWVRYNFPDLDETRRALYRFAIGMPRHTLQHAMRLLDSRLQFRTDWNTLYKSVDRDGRENSRHLCREVLEGFENHEVDLNLVGFKTYDFEVLPYLLSRDVSVPVKPLTTLNQNGQLQPVFVFGWASFALTDYQVRLMMTVIEDAVFSLDEYRHSKGHFIALPRHKNPDTGVVSRKPIKWQRGDYDLLNNSALEEQVEMYLTALDDVRTLLRADAEVKKPKEESRSQPDPRQSRFDF